MSPRTRTSSPPLLGFSLDSAAPDRCAEAFMTNLGRIMHLCSKQEGEQAPFLSTPVINAVNFTYTLFTGGPTPVLETSTCYAAMHAPPPIAFDGEPGSELAARMLCLRALAAKLEHTDEVIDTLQGNFAKAGVDPRWTGESLIATESEPQALPEPIARPRRLRA